MNKNKRREVNSISTINDFILLVLFDYVNSRDVRKFATNILNIYYITKLLYGGHRVNYFQLQST